MRERKDLKKNQRLKDFSSLRRRLEKLLPGFADLSEAGGYDHASFHSLVHALFDHMGYARGRYHNHGEVGGFRNVANVLVHP